MKNSRFLCQTQRILVSYELDEIRRYRDLISGLLVDAGQRRTMHLEDLEKSLPEDIRDESMENYAEEYQELTRHFPNQFRLSLLTLVYATFESRITRIARGVLTLMESPLTLRDFAGNSSFEKAERSILKVARFDLGADHWRRLDPYRQIRNAVVHQSGRFENQVPEPVRQFVTSSPHIEIAENGDVIVSDSFLEAFLNELDSFFEALFASWERWTSAASVPSGR